MTNFRHLGHALKKLETVLPGVTFTALVESQGLAIRACRRNREEVVGLTRMIPWEDFETGPGWASAISYLNQFITGLDCSHDRYMLAHSTLVEFSAAVQVPMFLRP